MDMEKMNNLKTLLAFDGASCYRMRYYDFFFSIFLMDDMIVCFG